jgi:lysophospholipase L1-like esterase
VGILQSRLVRRLRPGLAQTLEQAPQFRAAWDQSNRDALDRDGPLWVALGDSTAQGLGASAHDHGYVGQLFARLEARDGRAWRVLNFSETGARIKDVRREQLPRLESLHDRPALVTCSVGANDVIRFWTRFPFDELERLLEDLPGQSVVATLPKGLRRAPSRRVNEVIRRDAPRLGHEVADVWSHTGPPWDGKLAPDDFHPNDAGYRDWADAFAEVLGLPAA